MAQDISGGQLTEEKKENGRLDVKRQFIVLCIISFTLFSGYGVVLVLESSINIEGGTGM